MLSKLKKRKLIYVSIIIILLIGLYGIKDYLTNLSFQNTREYVDILAEKKAIQIQHELIVGLKIAKILSYSIEGQHERMYKFNALYRNSIISQIERVLKNYENIFGLWMDFEPKVFDRIDPKNFIGFIGSDYTGRFIPYLYREDNNIEMECADLMALNDSGGNTSYYDLVEEYKKEIITNPYYYSYVHKHTNVLYEKYMITVAHPIFYKNEFMGAVGVDFTLDLFQKIIESDNKYDFLDLHIILFSNDGTIVASNNKKHLEKNLSDIFYEKHPTLYYDILLHMIQNKDTIKTLNKCIDSNRDSYLVFVPIKVGNIEQTWSLMLSMPKEKMTRDVMIFIRGFVFLIITISLMIFLKKDKGETNNKC